MDLLPAAESSPEMAKMRKHGFRSLKLVNLNMDDLLSEDPFGVDYGTLDNGLSYYVRSNSKPKMRAALALAVKVGYVVTVLLNQSITFCPVFFPPLYVTSANSVLD